MSSGSGTRRRFLGFALALAAGWVAARVWLFRRVARDSSEGAPRGRAPSVPPTVTAIADRVERRFEYLRFEAEVSGRFAEDWIAAFGPTAKGGSDEELYDTFLLSTDFFQHGGDENRELRYVTFFSPYVSPCYNPLVRRDPRGA